MKGVHSFQVLPRGQHQPRARMLQVPVLERWKLGLRKPKGNHCLPDSQVSLVCFCDRISDCNVATVHGLSPC